MNGAQARAASNRRSAPLLELTAAVFEYDRDTYQHSEVDGGGVFGRMLISTGGDVVVRASNPPLLNQYRRAIGSIPDLVRVLDSIYECRHGDLIGFAEDHYVVDTKTMERAREVLGVCRDWRSRGVSR